MKKTENKTNASRATKLPHHTGATLSTALPLSTVQFIFNDFESFYHKVRKIILKVDYFDLDNDVSVFNDITRLGNLDSKYFLDLVRPRFVATKYSSKVSCVLPSSPISIPNQIKSPPVINSDGIVYSVLNENYMPIAKHDMYLNNFRVDWDRLPGYSNRRDHSQSNNQNVIHGRASMFERCYRPRVHSPMQAFIMNIFSYTCDRCNDIYFKGSNAQLSCTYTNCICFSTSSSLMAFVNLTDPGRGMPWLYKSKFQKVVRNTDYPFISSMLPCLMMSLLELASRKVLCAIDQAFECHLVNTYLKYSTTSLFARAMEYKSIVSEFDQYIFNNTNLIRFKTSANGSVFGYETISPGSDALIEISKFEELFGDIIDVKAVSGLSDHEGRLLLSYTQLLSNIPMVIATAPILSIKYSGQATAGSGISRPLIPTKVMLIGDLQVPIQFQDAYPEITQIRASIRKNIELNPPKLDKLESDYIDAATTNSAGLSKSDMDNIMRNAVSEWGEEAKMYSTLSNMRLIDAISHISKTFTTIENFESSLLDSTKQIMIGSRMQISRRQRSIFVVPTVNTLGPFLILSVLEPYVKKDKVTASGKTTGDIRDANQVLNNTSTPCTYNYSSDISGMDTSTFMGALRVVESVVLEYLATRRGEANPFFINKQDGISKLVLIQTQSINPDGSYGPTVTEEVSVLEYLIMVTMMLTSYNAKMVDGLFLSNARASSTVFQSGRFDTGIQHTTLNKAVEDVVYTILADQFAHLSVEVRPAVMGDDGSNKIQSLNDTSLEAAAKMYEDTVSDIWTKLGYKLEPVKSKFSAEFLKLYAVTGALSPYHYRVPLYSSEKGENYSRPVFGKLEDFRTVIYQLSSRVPEPNCNYGLLLLGHVMLGSIKIVLSRGDNIKSGARFLNRSTLAAKDAMTTKVNNVRRQDIHLPHDTWTDSLSNTHTIAYFPSLWFCAPVLAIPLPHISYKKGDVPALYASDGTCYSFRSPAVCRDLLRLVVNAPPKFDDKVRSMTFDAFKNWLDDPTNPQRVILLRYVKVYGIENLYLILRAYNLDFIGNISESIDKTVLRKTGINECYWLRDKLKVERTHLPSASYPNLDQFISNTDSFLDPSKRAASYFANNRLTTKYNMAVPQTMVYYHRLSSRTKDAIATSSEKIFMDIQMYETITSKFESFHTLLMNDLAYGDYHIIQSPRVRQNPRPINFFETGFGFAVPKGSMQSLILNEIGTPSIDAASHKAVKDSINRDVIVKGVQDNILRECAKIYARGSSDALELAFTALGLTGHNKDNVLRLLSINGAFIYTMPFTINPSQLYFFNVNLPTQYPDSFQPSKMAPERLEYFLYLCSLFHSPNLIETQNTIIMGPYLGRLLSIVGKNAV